MVARGVAQIALLSVALESVVLHPLPTALNHCGRYGAFPLRLRGDDFGVLGLPRKASQDKISSRA